MSLFELKDFTAHSGRTLHWKIECDALGDADWECLAFMISERQQFAAVLGVPSGGNKLAEKLQQYCNPQVKTMLLVDDVLTTGNSMESMRKAVSAAYDEIRGFVVFARGPCPDWVRALFQLTP